MVLCHVLIKPLLLPGCTVTANTTCCSLSAEVSTFRRHQPRQATVKEPALRLLLYTLARCSTSLAPIQGRIVTTLLASLGCTGWRIRGSSPQDLFGTRHWVNTSIQRTRESSVSPHTAQIPVLIRCDLRLTVLPRSSENSDVYYQPRQPGGPLKSLLGVE